MNHANDPYGYWLIKYQLIKIAGAESYDPYFFSREQY